MTQNSWQTFGFEKNKNILEKQLTSGKLPHAYLFVGQESIGKKSLALEFAGKILDSKNPLNHPDFQILDQEEEIGVEQIRQYISSLIFRPFVGSKKVSIINRAETMSIAAGSALLKTLEEPSESNVIILISSSRRLLPTLLSRCQIFVFNRFTTNQLKSYAGSANIKINSEILELCQGSVGRLLKLNNDKEYLQQQQENLNQFKKITQSSLAEKLISINSLADLEDIELEQKLVFWLDQSISGLEKESGKFVGNIKALLSALNNLRTNKNRKLILQGLMFGL